MDLGSLFRKEDRLIGLFATRQLQPTTILQSLLGNLTVLIIDVNHTWASSNLSRRSRIIQPSTREELLDLLRDLEAFIHPKLQFIIIDDLPLYFRDYYQGQQIQTQNMRAFGAAMALLDRVSKIRPVIYTSYPSGFNKNEPIMLHHSQYYSSRIYQLKRRGHTNVFVDIEDQVEILKESS